MISSIPLNVLVRQDLPDPGVKLTSTTAFRILAKTAAPAMTVLPLILANVLRDLRDSLVKRTSTIACRHPVIMENVSMVKIPLVVPAILDLRVFYVSIR